MKKNVDVIMLTWNQLESTKRCVESFKKYVRYPYRMICVDNGSTDGTLEYLKSVADVLIQNDVNLGAVKARNQGLLASDADYLLFIDNDIEVASDVIAQLLTTAESDDSIGIVGPLLNQKVPFNQQGYDVPLGLSLEEICQHVHNRSTDRPRDIDYVISCCMLAKRQVIDDVGLFDEAYIYYSYEDFDYCLRAKEFGHRVVLSGDCFVWHYINTSVKQFDDLEAITHTNAQTFAKRWKKRELTVAIIYDNIVRPDTTGEYCKRALEQMCTTVEHFTPAQLDTIPEGFSLYLNIDDGFQYTLPSHLRPAAWWVIDTHLQYEWDVKKARLFDFVFAAQKDGAERLRSDGIDTVVWLPLACDPFVHRPLKVSEPSHHLGTPLTNGDTTKGYDVVFVGNISPNSERARCLERIRKRFEKSFIGNAYFDEMAKIYSQSKIIFNLSIRNDINMRVFEAMACGGLLVTNDLAENAQNELFQPEVHFVTYPSESELIPVIETYLGDEVRRKKIARQGMLEVRTRHTYRKRMETLLDSVMEGLKKMNSESKTIPVKDSRNGKGEMNQGGQPRRGGKAPTYYRFSRPEVVAFVPESAHRILDVGCACGALGASLKSRQSCEVTGVEFVPEIAFEARERLDHVITGDIEQLAPAFPQKYYDCIVLADVLEHLRDPITVLEHLKDSLTDDGTFVLSVPNIRHWSVLKDLLEGRWQYVDAGILDNTHLRFFTRSSLIELLQAVGLQITQVQAVVMSGERISQMLVSALQAAGLDTRSLVEESAAYQYLITAQKAQAQALQQMSNPANGQMSKWANMQMSNPANEQMDIIRNPQSAIRNPQLVSIVILTCNQLEYTKLCVQSLKRYTSHPYEFIFVDNGSSDGTPEYLKTIAGAKVIENPENLGFPKACNQGIDVATGDYVLLLNNDVILTDQWLERLVACANSHSKIGIVGPMTNNISGQQRDEHAQYSSIDEMHQYAQLFHEKNRGNWLDCPRIVGFCMLIKREVVEKIGLLDERFGKGNFEDDDYCLRAHQAGYRTVIAGEVFIHHFGSVTFKHVTDYNALLKENEQKFREKWGSAKPAGLRTRWPAGLLASGGSHPVPVNEGEWSGKGVEGAVGAGLKAACTPARTLEVLQKAASLAPDSAEIHNELGKRFYQAGQVDEAKSAFQRALALEHQNAQVYSNLGVLFWETGDAYAAIDHLKKAIEIDRHDGDTVANLGMILHQVGMFQEAIPLFEKYLLSRARELRPEDEQIRYYLDDCYAQIGAHVSSEARSRFGASDEQSCNSTEHQSPVTNHQPPLPRSPAPSLSLCLIVKNEEKNLPGCLEGIAGLFDQIVVVDTGSEDGTAQIARTFGAEVHSFQWCDDFSAARNESLKHAKGDWIFWLDADDRMKKEEVLKLRELIKQGKDKAFFCVVGCLHPNQQETEFLQLRLFPNLPGVKFEGYVHEQVAFSLQRLGSAFVSSDVKITHIGYQSQGAIPTKTRRNLDLLLKQVQRTPDNLNVRFHLATHYEIVGDVEKAIDELKILIDRTRGKEGYRDDYLIGCVMLGNYLRRLNHVEEAIASYQQALEVKEDYGLACFFLGELYYKLKGFDQAREYLSKVETFGIEVCMVPLPVKRIYFYTSYYLGGCHAVSGNPGLAILEYQKALAIDPSSKEVYHQLGQLYLSRKEYEKAIEALDKANALPSRPMGEGMPTVVEAEYEEDEAGSYCDLGVAYLYQQKFSEAEAAFKKVIELRANLPEAYANLALALSKQGKGSEAIPMYHKALELNPFQIEALTNLGHLYLHKGLLEEARQMFVKALEMKPELLDVHLGLASIFASTKDTRSLLERCREIAELHPELMPKTLNEERIPSHFLKMGKVLEGKGMNIHAALAYRIAHAYQSPV